jgi:hypothetical protein
MMLVELVTQTAALVIDREQAKSTLDDLLAMHARAPESRPVPEPPDRPVLRH